MDSYSWANHILRSLLIWALVFATLTVKTIKPLKLTKAIMIATLVTVFFVVTEYLLMPLYVPDFCNIVCPVPFNTDTSLDEAVAKLKLQEQAGPAVKPDITTEPQVPVQVPVPITVSAPQIPQVPVPIPDSAPQIPQIPQVTQIPQLPPPVSTSVRV